MQSIVKNMTKSLCFESDTEKSLLFSRVDWPVPLFMEAKEAIGSQRPGALASRWLKIVICHTLMDKNPIILSDTSMLHRVFCP